MSHISESAHSIPDRDNLDVVSHPYILAKYSKPDIPEGKDYVLNLNAVFLGYSEFLE
jgi:hypothetical protein